MSTQQPSPTSWLARVEERLETRWERYRFWIYLWGGLALLLFIYFAPSTFVTVRSGEQGVMFRRFGGGTVMDRTYTEGLHIVLPWDTLHIYNVRVQQAPVSFTVLSQEGLEIGFVVSVRFHPPIEQLGLLHKRVGPEYFEKIIKPAVISRVRAMAGTMTVEQVYATRRAVLEQMLGDSIRHLNDSYLVLDDLLIERVMLPESVQGAIQAKARAHQAALEYDFRLQIEEKEAERKRIEARGIHDFQETVSQGISEALLRWRGIEATLELAKSNNAKVVVIGAGKDGLPLIMDTTADTRAPISPGAPAAPNKAPVATPSARQPPGTPQPSQATSAQSDER